MAKERVQVQGLGDVAPGIQPTIQRAGQYGIQVQRAGRNKLMDLADALSQVNPTLQQYIGVAEQEAQIFEEELARKSPEEVQAMLKQTEGELDKQVRRGAMGWLTSPLNQKRKMQAVGALLHDDYERQLKTQVEDPANADADINELIAGVKDNLRNQYGSLQSAFVNEGFEGAIRETTRRYTLAHDSIATEQARSELNRAGKSVLFNASTLVNGEIADPEAITNWWSENEGAFTPSELKQLRDDVVLLHASRGNFEAAREFQEYTSKFKAGTTKMGDPDIKEDDVFGMYSAEEASLRQRIDDMELKSDARLVANAQNELRIFDELANDIGRAIRNKEGYKVDDQTIIKTAEQAENYLLEELQKSKNIIVRGSKGRSLVQNALKAYEVESNDENRYLNFGNKYSQVELNRGPNSFRFGYESALDNFKREYSTVDKFTNKIIFDPRFQKLSNDLLAEMTRKRANKMQELSSGRFTDIEGNTVVVSKFEDQIHYMKAWDNLYLQEFNQKLKEQGDILQPKIKLTNESKIKTSDTKDEDVKSFVNPDQALSDATTYWFTPDHNFADLEDSLRAGEVGEINSALKDLEEKKAPQISELIQAFPVYPKKLSAVDRALNTLNSAKSSEADIQESKRMLSIYALAKGKYNTESIRNGFIEIEGKEVKIDKESLKDLVDIYPLIPKERLIDISETEPEEFPEEQALFEAIYDVELEETEEDKQLLIKFIEKQARLSEKIHKS
jgi:hypothetical protein